MRDIVHAYPRLETQGFTVATVFESPCASIAGHVERQSPLFPIVGDPQVDLGRRLEVEA